MPVRNMFIYTYPGIFADKSSRINWQVFSHQQHIYVVLMSSETGIPCKVPKKLAVFFYLSGPFLTEPVDFGYVGKGHVHNPVMKPRYQTSVQEKAALLARKRDLEPGTLVDLLFVLLFYL